MNQTEKLILVAFIVTYWVISMIIITKATVTGGNVLSRVLMMLFVAIFWLPILMYKGAVSFWKWFWHVDEPKN